MSDSSRLDELLRRVAEESAPSEDRVRRVEQRLNRSESLAVRPLLRQLPGPTSGAVWRVEARLGQAIRGESMAHPTWPRALIFSLGVAAGLLGLVLFQEVSTGPAPSLTLSPAPDVAEPVMDSALSSPQDWAVLDSIDGVTVQYRGQGSLGGSAQAPRIEWSTGKVDVTVEPGLGIDLAVHTREARVEVVGTRFDVTRNAEGSHVHVTRGVVSLRCIGGAQVQLHADDRHTCASMSPAALANRAGQLLFDQDDAAGALQIAREGLHTAEGPSRSELRYFEAVALKKLGRTQEAIGAYQAYLELEHAPRTLVVQAELQRLVAQEEP